MEESSSGIGTDGLNTKHLLLKINTLINGIGHLFVEFQYFISFPIWEFTPVHKLILDILKYRKTFPLFVNMPA